MEISKVRVFSWMFLAGVAGVNLSDARLAESRFLTLPQLRRAVVNEFTSLPPHLEPHRDELLRRSKSRAAYLKSTFTVEEADRYFGQFGFVD